MAFIKTLFRLHEDFGEVGLGEELLHEVDDLGGLELFDEGAAIGVHIHSPTLFPPHGVERITAVCGTVFFSDDLIVEQVKYLAGCLGNDLILE